MDDIATWEALIGRRDGYEHAWDIATDCLLEHAADAAMERAVQDWACTESLVGRRTG